jgi:hypothetical protein
MSFLLLPHVDNQCVMQKSYQSTIYHLLYYVEIGEKIEINTENIDLIWRNLEIYRKKLRKTYKFKTDKVNNSTYIIWRTQ